MEKKTQEDLKKQQEENIKILADLLQQRLQYLAGEVSELNCDSEEIRAIVYLMGKLKPSRIEEEQEFFNSQSAFERFEEYTKEKLREEEEQRKYETSGNVVPFQGENN